MEQIVIVDDQGFVTRCSFSKELAIGENTAVELVIVYLPHSQQIVLFNRGDGASDMHDHWALQSGKVNTSDLCEPSGYIVGAKLPVCAYKNAARREFGEELNFPVEPEAFQYVDEFYMPDKQIYFTLLSLALEQRDLTKLVPNQFEVDNVKCFTREEFENNAYLGDAIVFHKQEIVRYLRQVFGEFV